jgi:hypothetical protein
MLDKEWVDFIQWPVMALTDLAARLVASLRKIQAKLGGLAVLSSN